MIVLDIGGEGRHRRAFNLNPSRVRTLGRGRGVPIPRLIVGRGDAIPLADQSVDRILVERTPLSRIALCEIRRVLKPQGRVTLRHVPLPHGDRHRLAASIFSGRVRKRSRRVGGQTLLETTIDGR